jgi:hypothetical protein
MQSDPTCTTAFTILTDLKTIYQIDFLFVGGELGDQRETLNKGEVENGFWGFILRIGQTIFG